jgi:hypothetical protein
MNPKAAGTLSTPLRVIWADTPSEVAPSPGGERRLVAELERSVLVADRRPSCPAPGPRRRRKRPVSLTAPAHDAARDRQIWAGSSAFQPDTDKSLGDWLAGELLGHGANQADAL